MLNIEYLRYTYMHRKAFEFVVRQIVKDGAEKEALLERAKWHDLDKSLLYTLMDKKLASKIHRAINSHHMENDIDKSYIDKLEAIIDYESAGYTKADKPRNAYDTVRDLLPEHTDQLLPIMEHLGIAYSYQNTPDNEAWQAFINGLKVPSDEMILDEIYKYILHDPVEANKIYQIAEENGGV